MPVLFTPQFDPTAMSQYAPCTLDSSNPQVALLSEDLGLPDLVNCAAWLPPSDLERLDDGTPVMHTDDVDLLPNHQLDAALRKMSGKGDDTPAYLRSTEYTEILGRDLGMLSAVRARKRTLQEQERPQLFTEFEDAGEEGFAQGIERTFTMAAGIDMEFQREQLPDNEKDPTSKRQWLVHPNPVRRAARPVRVHHVFPHFEMWKNNYVSGNFVEGNPIPPTKLVPPGTDFHALPFDHQRALFARCRHHDDSVLVPLGDNAESDEDAATEKDQVLSYLIPRIHSSKLPEQLDGESEEEGSSDDSDDVKQNRGRKRKRQREYERVADFVIAPDVQRTSRATRDFALLFGDSEGACSYVKLDDQMCLKRRVHSTEELDRRKGKIFVLDHRPFTGEERLEREKRYRTLRGDDADSGNELGNEQPLNGGEKTEPAAVA